MTTSASAVSMVRNASEKEMGNGDFHKVIIQKKKSQIQATTNEPNCVIFVWCAGKYIILEENPGRSRSLECTRR